MKYAKFQKFTHNFNTTETAQEEQAKETTKILLREDRKTSENHKFTLQNFVVKKLINLINY